MTAPAVNAADAFFDGSLNFDRKNAHGLPFVLLNEIRNDPIPKRYLIKGVMARGETSAWIAPPGGMKSALMAQVSICVSSGTDWHGRKNKGAAGVVYFALERADLVVRRLRAHLARAGLGELPIAIVSFPINLMTPKMVPVVIGTIRDAASCFGLPVGLVVFDTFAKLIATGGGDEDKAKDQGAVFANIQLIKSEIDAHIALVGHTGKDETRGARGSNAILGDVDLMVTITGDTIKTATVIKANDMPEGPLFSFKSEVHEFGIDEDGDAITVNIIGDAMVDGEQIVGRKLGKKLPKGALMCLRALHHAIGEVGYSVPSLSAVIPAGQRVVDRSDWRRFAYSLGVSASDEERARQLAFTRGVDALLLAGAISILDDRCWPVAQNEHSSEQRTPL